MDRKQLSRIIPRWKAFQMRANVARSGGTAPSSIRAFLLLGDAVRDAVADSGRPYVEATREISRAIRAPFDTISKARLAASRLEQAERTAILGAAKSGHLRMSHVAVLASVAQHSVRKQLLSHTVEHAWSVVHLISVARGRRGRQRQAGAGRKPRRPETLAEETQQVISASRGWLAKYDSSWSREISWIRANVKASTRDHVELSAMMQVLASLMESARELRGRGRKLLARIEAT